MDHKISVALTYKYYYVHTQFDGSIILSMTSMHPIVFRIQVKVTGPQNKGHMDLHIL